MLFTSPRDRNTDIYNGDKIYIKTIYSLYTNILQSRDPGGGGGQCNYQATVLRFGQHFFSARCASFHIHSTLLTFFICFLVLFNLCCSDAQLFGQTLEHECHISYSHTDWYMLFRSAKALKNWERSSVNKLIILN